MLSAKNEGVIFKNKVGHKSPGKLISGNETVLSVIQRFNNRGEHVDDLFQVGCIGMIKQ